MPSELDNHTILGPLLRYWQAQRGNRRMPARKDIDPVAIAPFLLPHLLLCDLVDRGRRIRYRLVGTDVVRRWGIDPTGCFLDEGMSPYFANLAELNRLVVMQRAPVHAVSALCWGVDREIEVHQLLLPLSESGTESAVTLIGIVLRSDEVFPPQIRSLHGICRFEERRKTVCAEVHRIQELLRVASRKANVALAEIADRPDGVIVLQVERQKRGR